MTTGDRPVPDFEIVDLADHLDENYMEPWEPENVAEVLAQITSWEISLDDKQVEEWAIVEGYI